MVITSTDKVKNLILGGGGCGRKQSLVVEVVTERRCQGLRLASVSAGNKTSKVYEREEEERKKAELPTRSGKILGVVYWHMEQKGNRS